MPIDRRDFLSTSLIVGVAAGSLGRRADGAGVAAKTAQIRNRVPTPTDDTPPGVLRRYVQVGGRQMHCLGAGKEPPLVMIHASPRARRLAVDGDAAAYAARVAAFARA